MAASIPKNSDKTEIIGRWKISKLIHKGRNTWIHEGIDIENGKIVALKFISKADKSWVKQQAKQIETEIESLQKVRHKHVIKLYAYNLEAKYPNPSSKKYIATVLLVLEYASCGELFNLLYYTSGLNENISRTYFKQIISGIELCHNKGIIHRDLRPKNILLNNNYYIKITNFNTSKIIKSDSDFLMNTKFIGSRSYQSPEILLANNNKNDTHYDFKCDIFSLGVILFILMAGYPPFEEATKKDKWYKPIIDKNYDKFWKYHRNAPIADLAKDLLNKMLTFEPSERMSIADIKKHDWFNGTTLGRFTLQMAIQQRHRLSEQLRRQNIQKKEIEIADPNKLNKTVEEGKPYKIFLYPLNKTECIEGDVYTFGYNNTRSIYDSLSAIISQDSGSTQYNEIDNVLYCKMNTPKKYNGEILEMQIKFIITIYESRLWLNRYLESDDKEEIKQKQQDIIYIVSIQRTEGDELLYRKIKNEFLLQKCSLVLQGLPKWTKHMKPTLDEYGLELLFNRYCIITNIPLKIKNIIYDFYRGKQEKDMRKHKRSMCIDQDIDNYDQSLLDFKW